MTIALNKKFQVLKATKQANQKITLFGLERNRDDFGKQKKSQ